MARSKNGQQLFEDYYKSVYQDRWPSLYQALQAERVYAAIYPQESPQAWLHPWLSYPTNNKSDHSELKDGAYFLDPASAWAADQLPVKPGDTILDMCAAPGGKSLMVAKRLGGQGKVVCNDYHPQRLGRLRKVLPKFAPESIWSSYCKDGAWYGMNQPGHYDAVILDAPCSSERHWIQDTKLLAQWRIGRTKNLAIRQRSLLASSIDTVKIGGYILYMTCSISPRENDAVIDWALNKRRVCVKAVDNLHDQTEHGVMILPNNAKDKNDSGWGPLYLSLLQRV